MPKDNKDHPKDPDSPAKPKDPAPMEKAKDPPEKPKDPEPKAKPADPPEKAKPKADPARQAAVEALLQTARFQLAERELELAKQSLAAAEKLNEGQSSDEIQRVKLLAHYVSEFWSAVRSEVKRLKGADVLTIEGITIAFVEGGDDYVIFRQEGANRRFQFKTMKSGLAYGLAELYLAKDDPVSHLVLGAFLTVNPTSDRAAAKQQWTLANSRGDDKVKQEVARLLPELQVTIPKEAPKLPKETLVGTKPAAGDEKLTPPSGAALTKAIEGVRGKYTQQLIGATDEAKKMALVETMLSDAESDNIDAASRYATLLEARDLAASSRKIQSALDIITRIEAEYKIDVLVMKIDVLAVSQKSAGDDAGANKDVTMNALALADEAALLEKFPQAARLAAMAVQTARKAKDAELLKQATAREKEIRALKPSGT